MSAVSGHLTPCWNHINPVPPARVLGQLQHSIDKAAKEEALRVQVEQCARELARVINRGESEWRMAFRDAAIELLCDTVETVPPVLHALDTTEAAADAVPTQTSNPIAIAIPLVMVGAVMVILFPPIGLLLFAAAGVMVVWGLASVFFGR